MNDHDPAPTPTDSERMIDRRVRRALSAMTSALEQDESRTAADSVLRRIGGRSPRAVADVVVAGRLRAGAAVAAAVLMGLSWFEREPTSTKSAVTRPDDVSVLALSDPDADRDERRTRPSDVVVELFDLATEVPQ